MSGYSDEENEMDHAEDQQTQQIERPKFTLTLVPHDLEDDIMCLRIQNDVMAVVGKNNRLIVRDFDGNDAPYMQNITQTVHNLFLDPTGKHVFISTQTGDFLYFNPSLKIKGKVSLSGSTTQRAVGVVGNVLSVIPGTGTAEKQLPSTTFIVESVGWDKTNTSEYTTGNILIGSKRFGLVYEVRVDVAQKKREDLKDEIVAAVTLGNLGKGNDMQATVNDVFKYGDAGAISSIEIEWIEKCPVVLMGTKFQFFRFIGSPGQSLREMFEMYKDPSRLSIIEHNQVADTQTRGNITIFRPFPHCKPQSYAWGSDVSVVHGVFNTKDQMRGSARNLIDHMDQDHLMTRERIDFGRNRPAGFDRVPIDVTLSAFHIYLLYDDRIVVLGHPAGLPWKSLGSFSNNQPGTPMKQQPGVLDFGTEATATDFSMASASGAAQLQEYDFADRCRFDSSTGRKVKQFKAFERDTAKRKIYAYNPTTVWELNVEKEYVSQWRIFFELALDEDEPAEARLRYFRAAYNLTKQHRERHDAVTYELGKFQVQNKQYTEAAKTFAECRRFEDILQYLWSLGISSLVIDFLEHRLVRLIQRSTPQNTHQSQLACITALLLMQHLDRVQAFQMDPRMNEMKKTESAKQLAEFLIRRTQDMRDLLDDNAYYRVVEQMLSAQGTKDILLGFAEGMKRFRYALSSYCRHSKDKRFDRACNLLVEKCINPQYANLWYEYGPIVIQHKPCAMITGLIKNSVVRVQGDGQTFRSLLRPELLIPAFINYEPRQNEDQSLGSEHQVIAYLTHLVKRKCADAPVVWNYLVTLMLKFKESTFLLPGLLMETGAKYTVEFVLRKCLASKSPEALEMCIVLYRRLGLVAEAVNAALSRPDLEEGIDQAKSLIKEADTLESTTVKRLWRNVAEAVLKARQSTAAVLDIVKESGGALKLEDVLATLTKGDTVLQEIKDAICESLDEYASTIKQLKHKMVDATATAKRIKEEEKDLTHQFGYITATQNCDICNKALLRNTMAAPFVIYPSCRHAFHEHCVMKLIAQCTENRRMRMATELGLGPQAADDVEALKNADCPYCGELAITEVEVPYFTPGGKEEDIWHVSHPFEL